MSIRANLLASLFFLGCSLAVVGCAADASGGDDGEVVGESHDELGEAEIVGRWLNPDFSETRQAEIPRLDRFWMDLDLEIAQDGLRRS
jgi:hypothetical protein